jgi:DNA primase large subunit
MRLAACEATQVKDLLNSRLGVKYDSLTDTDPTWIKHKKMICFNQKDQSTCTASNFIKVPFKESLQLVGRRQVFLHKGFAFVPIKDLQSIACAHFRYRLSQELIKAYKHLPMILKD